MCRMMSAASQTNPKPQGVLAGLGLFESVLLSRQRSSPVPPDGEFVFDQQNERRVGHDNELEWTTFRSALRAVVDDKGA